MVVVASRVEVVRWQLAIDKYIKSQDYTIRTLVAFSGEVNDKESGPDPFSENSKTLNPNLKGRDIREAFATGEYQVLLVANKFQTGFDQPLLCGMYVDKRLAGIQAVQTLSRLNRAYPGKDTTYVLDFVNSPEEVLDAFKVYFTTATLENVTDPNLVYEKQSLSLVGGQYPTLQPLAEAGSGELRDPLKSLLAEIIAQVNDLFEGDLTDDDKLVYVNNVLKGKLLESQILVEQAASNSKEQFANSPDLSSEITNAIMDALAAHSTMSKQALDSEKVRSGLKDILLGPARLYEALRERGGAGKPDAV